MSTGGFVKFIRRNLTTGSVSASFKVLPIGPLYVPGPAVSPSMKAKYYLNGSSFKCNRHMSHCSALPRCTSSKRMTPPFGPVLVGQPSAPAAFNPVKVWPSAC